MSTAIELTNQQVRLAARPVGLVQHSDFSFSEEPVREPADGEALVDISYISLDPAMRGWMTDLPSYIPPVGIGEVMRTGRSFRVDSYEHTALGDLARKFTIVPAIAVPVIVESRVWGSLGAGVVSSPGLGGADPLGQRRTVASGHAAGHRMSIS